MSVCMSVTRFVACGMLFILSLVVNLHVRTCCRERLACCPFAAYLDHLSQGNPWCSVLLINWMYLKCLHFCFEELNTTHTPFSLLIGSEEELCVCCISTM